MARHNLRAYLRHIAKTVRPSFWMPEEMLYEIFSWLPPESLIRFKCVCKSWYSLITSIIKNPFFVATHLGKAQNNVFSPESLLIVGHHVVRPGQRINHNIFLLNVSDDGGEKDEIHPVIEELDLRSPWGRGNMRDDKFRRMMGSDLCKTEFYHCDGIICLMARDKIMLWNPALVDSKILPPANNVFNWKKVEATGIGYDPIATDYKILRIWTHDLIEMYSLNTNTWNETSKGPDKVNMLEYKMEVCHKGVCYWFFNGCRKNMVRSVNLHSGQSQIIPLPGRKSCSRTLQVWNDSIAFVSFHRRKGTTGSIEMWVTRNYSGTISDSSLWIKYLSIVNPEGIRRPLRILKGDELLLKGEDESFFFYNLHTRRLRKLIIDEIGGIIFWGSSYVESLVSVNRQGQA
ncbi:F-box domain containing protein [Trema orientale]|uniref:F-box domain containing protein n=1 Tax=Trema orientale TaxID=63057 RepID=A0A2P5FIK9_TREOI|nr:F-box domain containing protein [Trema orientale]